MDPISLAASIITMLAALSTTADAASRFWTTPDDLQRLASELTDLAAVTNNLVLIIQAQELRHVDLQPLQSTCEKLRQAQKTFEQRLSKKHSKGAQDSRFRRRTWLTQRNAIKTLSRDVVNIRNELNTVLQLLTLSTVSVFTGRIHDSRLFVSTSSNCHRPLLDCVTTSDTEMPAMVHTSTTSNDVAEVEEFFDAVSSYSESIHELLDFCTPSTSFPGWSLETSPSFFPEQYVIENLEHHRSFVFSITELQKTSTTSVERYCLFFVDNVRHWKRVTVYATKSLVFHTQGISTTKTDLNYHVLPGLVQSGLEELLKEAETLYSVTKIQIELKIDEQEHVSFEQTRARISEDSEESSAESEPNRVLELEHRGLRRYAEGDVIVLRREMSFLFVLVDGQLCIERKLPFTSGHDFNRRPIDEFAYNLDCLQRAHGCPHVAALVGVVINVDGTSITSYLVKAPEQGPINSLLLESNGKNIRIPWQRRERWIRQLVVATTELHRRGVVIGYRPWTKDELWLDENDDLVIVGFTSRATSLSNRQGRMPPELRHLTEPAHPGPDLPLTYQSDLFALGHFIWRVSQCVTNVTQSILLCSRNDCTARHRYRCKAEHANPVQLPRCDSEEVPDWINALVDRCRRADPLERIPAHALLAFIPETSTDIRPAFVANHVLKERERNAVMIFCDGCLLDCTALAHYHCKVCCHGELDLCRHCVEVKGTTCNDKTHQLSLRIFESGGYKAVVLKDVGQGTA